MSATEKDTAFIDSEIASLHNDIAEIIKTHPLSTIRPEEVQGEVGVSTINRLPNSFKTVENSCTRIYHTLQKW